MIQEVDSDEESQPDLGECVNSKTTIEVEKKFRTDLMYDEEIFHFNQENNMSLEELYTKHRGKIGSVVVKISSAD